TSLACCIAILYARPSWVRLGHPLRYASQLADFRFIICFMPNPNPLAGVVPQVVHPVNDGETTVSQYVEKIEGEVALDTYVKAQWRRLRCALRTTPGTKIDRLR